MDLNLIKNHKNLVYKVIDQADEALNLDEIIQAVNSMAKTKLSKREVTSAIWSLISEEEIALNDRYLLTLSVKAQERRKAFGQTRTDMMLRILQEDEPISVYNYIAKLKQAGIPEATANATTLSLLSQCKLILLPNGTIEVKK